MIDPNSEVCNWRSWVTHANITDIITVAFSDNGTPSLSATQKFVVIVNPLNALVLAVRAADNGRVNLLLTGPTGPDYVVQISSNLVRWSTEFVINSPVLPLLWNDTNAAGVW